MIFVILGTQDKQFTRLLEEINTLILDGIISQSVVVQAGTTKYKSKNMEIHKMIPQGKFLEYMEQSEYIITHGGVGTILDAMKKNKKVIAVPRRKMYAEHENDHQVQIIEKFSKEKYIIGCESVSDLKSAICQIETFKPKKCVLGNERMTKLLTHYIENTPSSKRKDIMVYGVYALFSLILQIFLYFVFQTFHSLLFSMWISWFLSYILLIVYTYPKRNYLFEILFVIFVTSVQLLGLDMVYYNIIPYLGITVLIDIIAYIGHTCFYKRWSK